MKQTANQRMCKNEDALLKDLSPVGTPVPAGVRASSTISSSSSDGSDSEGDNSMLLQESSGTSLVRRKQAILSPCLASFIIKGDLLDGRKHVFSATFSSCASAAISIASGVANAAFWSVFALYFPFMLAPRAATETYHTAYYEYQHEKSHFDNTAWTYATDYALAIIMAVLVASILRHSKPGSTDKLCQRSASLLGLYGLSVTAGGISHQFFTSIESRNSPVFRMLWTTCVGTVCLASWSMGMIGSEAIRKFQHHYTQRQPPSTKSTSTYLLMKVPLISDAFWMAFGLTVAGVCAVGGLSFQRPACDIFVAGITQSLSTFYCMIFFFLVDHKHVKNWAKVMGFVGFILNAPLLPMYPLLVQYTDWSLASVNTLLHSWLCVAWSMQGISMQHVIQALVNDEIPNVAKKDQ
jgi:hypothetical protein